MLRHIVFWKIKDNEDKEKNMERMVKMLYALDGKIKGLESIELGYNFDQSSEYDVVLYAIFKSPAALKFYQNHPEHVKCKEFISTVAVKRTSVDYVPEDPEFMTFEVPEEPDTSNEVKSVTPTTSETPLEPSKEEAKANEKTDTSIPDIQTSSAAGYQSLVRPIIPGINAPIDFNPSEEPKEESDSFISQIVQKSIRETQEDYDVLESVVDDDSFGTNDSEEVSSEYESPVEDTKSITSTSTVTDEPGVEVKPAETIEPPAAAVEPVKSAEPIKPIGSNVSTEPIKPVTPIQAAEKKSASMPFSHSSSASIVEEPESPKVTFAPSEKGEFEPKAVKQEELKTDISEPLISIPKPEAAVKISEPSVSVSDAVKPIEPHQPIKPPISAIPTSAKPQKKSRFFGAKKVQEEAPKAEDMTNKWRCPSCGRVNANYVGTCGCGESKPFEDFEQHVETKDKKEETEQNGWKCPKCGLLHSNFISDCSCGYVKNPGFTVKPVNDESSHPDFKNEDELPPVAPMRATDFSSNFSNNIGTNMPKPAPMEVSTVDADTVKGLKFSERSNDVVPPAVERSTPSPVVSRPVPPPPPIIKPEKKSFFGRKKKAEEIKEEIDMTKFWKCPSCGKLNHNYVGTCGCGESKPFEFDFGNNNDGETFVPKSNAWKCPDCGRLNNNFVTKCSCGYESGIENAE